MPPSPELSSMDYTPDNAAQPVGARWTDMPPEVFSHLVETIRALDIAYCMAQAAHWTRIRKALLSRGIKGRGLHLATSRIGVWTSKAARL